MKLRPPHFRGEDCADKGQEQWNAAGSDEHRSERGPLPMSDLITAKTASHQDGRDNYGTGPGRHREDAHNCLRDIHWSNVES
jgi:hypothetical protein